MTRNEHIAHQVESAKAVISKFGYTVPAVIKAIKASPRSRKEVFGFHFEEGLSVGFKGTHDDGSVFEVVAIVG